MKIGFIGAGKVGYSLGKLFSEAGIHVIGYYSRHIESAKEAAQYTNTDFFDSSRAILEKSDTLFLTVPDGQITAVYEELVSYGISDKIICHCSGALSAREAFPDIASHNAYGYSLHPLFPVSDKLTSYRELTDAFFCVEGDEKYLTMWKQCLESLGLKTLTIKENDKAKYHCACATASNLVCGILDQAVSLLTECGFSEANALDALRPLVESNLTHVFEEGPKAALTGPVERADVLTVKKHLECLAGREKEEELALYKAASLKCVSLAEEKHRGRDYREIKTLLQS